MINKYLPIVLILTVISGSLFFPTNGETARARITNKTATPYRGAIVVRDDTGEAVFEKNSDISCYPASIVKLMMLLIIQEKIENGSLHLDDQVVCTAAAARMGGSQVYLKENEIFSIEDLLYSLIIQSANDSAVALAIHVAGSKDGFVEMMRKKARELGMKNTEFHSVHGLPPGRDQEPDISTPEDIAILSRELLKHPDILNYTSTQVRGFRNNTFEMRSHNPLLGSFDGCDGLKTGYFRAGGFSIAATADRDGLRLIAVVMGSKKKEDRNSSVRNILAQAFSSLPAPGPGKESAKTVRKKNRPPAVKSRVSAASPETIALPDNTQPTDNVEEDPAEENNDEGAGFWTILLYVILFLIQAGLFFWLGRKSKPDSSSGFPPTILSK
ncbi:MAG TPA: D-alanyl-D-alanine carboxypeptidase [Proteobacteria bacterium]|nr:D-alanyl-D-alanine carboxypeptidase [Pseudomonadota bacterium]